MAFDGSFAAFVPAARALSWQLTDWHGDGVVRERYWLTFQPGEVRVCSSCHGVNDRNQAGGGKPTNLPVALVDLLRFWEESQARQEDGRHINPGSSTETSDLDPTDDAKHEAQQYTLFNEYYDTWCYLPLLAFLTLARESEQYLCAALLRDGKAVVSDGMDGLSSRLVPLLRRAFPGRAFSFGSTAALPIPRSLLQNP